MAFSFIDYDSISVPPFTQYLRHIRDHELDTIIRSKVVTDALDGYDHPRIYFTDLLEHGCISGMVPDLVYYTETRAFYDTHYFEIESLREAYKEQTGECITQYCNGDLKNFLSWFAYEQTARQMWQAFHIDEGS